MRSRVARRARRVRAPVQGLRDQCAHKRSGSGEPDYAAARNSVERATLAVGARSDRAVRAGACVGARLRASIVRRFGAALSSPGCMLAQRSALQALYQFVMQCASVRKLTRCANGCRELEGKVKRLRQLQGEIDTLQADVITGTARPSALRSMDATLEDEMRIMATIVLPEDPGAQPYHTEPHRRRPACAHAAPSGPPAARAVSRKFLPRQAAWHTRKPYFCSSSVLENVRKCRGGRGSVVRHGGVGPRRQRPLGGGVHAAHRRRRQAARPHLLRARHPRP